MDDNGDGIFDRAERYAYDSAGKRDPATGVPLDDIVLIFTDPDGAGPQPSTLSSRLVHGPAIDQVFASESATGEVLWSLTDHQGTVRDVAKYNSGTDTTTVVNHLKYDSFGNITDQSNSTYSPRFTYTNREWDADIGLFYYRARWYDPNGGRFLSEDPLGFAAGDTNVSHYAENNAPNRIDPSGLDSVFLACVGGACTGLGHGSAIIANAATLAPHVSAGIRRDNECKVPVGTTDKLRVRLSSLTGLKSRRQSLIPALKCWAIFGCPCRDK